VSDDKTIRIWKCSVCGKKEKAIERTSGGFPTFMNLGPICSNCMEKAEHTRWDKKPKG
jgi:hypothetical protein